MEIRILITGRMYHLAADVPNALELPEGATVQDALEQLSTQAELPASCLVALNGEHLGTLTQCANRSLGDNAELTLIAPVAGG